MFTITYHCFESLETRKNKRVPSSLLKQLIKIVLSSNVFRFGNKLFRQIKGTAMGTPMAPNFANLFMGKFERNLMNDFFKEHGIRPLVWFRYIDDIFFIWTHGEESLKNFIQFAQNYAQGKKMKSNIKFEVNISDTTVDFLDITVVNNNGVLTTTLYTKPTDAHLFLNKSSDHPPHVIKNLPRGQFIRIRRICSDKLDYLKQSRKHAQFFIERGYNANKINKHIKEVGDICRESLLVEKDKVEKDIQIIFVSDWHPLLKKLPNILREHHHILLNDKTLCREFPQAPLVAFRRAKSLRNHIVKNDIGSNNSRSSRFTTPCNRCKLCANISKNQSEFVSVNDGKLRIISGGSCKSSNLIYAAFCTKHNKCYIGQTGKTLSDRFNRHRYDIKKRSDNCELAEHFHDGHDLDKDLSIIILQKFVDDNPREREFYEDR